MNQMQDRQYVLGYVALADAGDVNELEAVTGIGEWCETRGWRLARVIYDIRPERGRPGLDEALDELRTRHAAGLVVARLSDLADTVQELGALLQWFADTGAFLIALDYAPDEDELADGALTAISAWERSRER
jgi:DNA invertase Pin-like site-specific DNA recombinase